MLLACYVDNTVVLLIEVALVGQEELQGQVSSGPCGKHDGPSGPSVACGPIVACGTSVACGPSGPSDACVPSGPSGMLM